MRLRFIVTFVAILNLGGGTLGASPARASDTFTILDTLGVATPTTTFNVFGSSGISILSSQFVGPQFVLTEPTVITEIGAFVNNCKSIIDGVPECPGTLSFTVQIRPSVNGAPDPSTVLATFVLSHDNDPLVISYESVAPNFIFAAGSYFALFAPLNADEGGLLSGASSPFNYQAGSTTLGFLNPTTGTSFASTQFGSVRILGRLLPSFMEACKHGGWQSFDVFENQGDCVSHVATHGRNQPK